MTVLTFHGGIEEIGGNKILIEDDDTKIFLDFGISFSLKKKFYLEPYLKPKSCSELLNFELIPEIDGIYKFDKHEANIDAVFLSHCHLDHSGHISLLKGEIPVFCGETTETMLKALYTIRHRSFETDISNVNFKKFRTGNKIHVGSLEIEPVHCDHSVPGAYGFLIHSSSGSIVYTGDFRIHGAAPELTREFIEKAEKSDPIVFITEGTNLVNAGMRSEKELALKLETAIEESDGLVLTQFAPTDIDRLKSFFEASARCERKIAIPLKHAYLLKTLKKDKKLKVPGLSDGEIVVFQKAKKHYFKWEKEIAAETNPVDSSYISKNQSKFVVALPFYDFAELTDIKPKPGSIFILSSSEPFDEEQEIEYKRLVNWLNHYGLPLYHLHVSGHIMPLDLLKVTKRIKPKVTIPVHTEQPVLFKRFLGEQTQVKIVKKGGTYQL